MVRDDGRVRPHGHPTAGKSRSSRGRRMVAGTSGRSTSRAAHSSRSPPDHGDQNMPTWSHDGDWIYFSWKQANARDFWQRDIWRTRVRKGSMEQVTHGGGGYVGRESADGKTLLYQPALRTSPVMAQPLAGGAPGTLIACVIGTAVAVTDSGIYYVPCSASFAPGQTARTRDGSRHGQGPRSREAGAVSRRSVNGRLRRLARWQDHPVQSNRQFRGRPDDDRELSIIGRGQILPLGPRDPQSTRCRRFHHRHRRSWRCFVTPSVSATSQAAASPELLDVRSGALTVRGQVWRPPGDAPLPAVLFNHGSYRCGR